MTRQIAVTPNYDKCQLCGCNCTIYGDNHVVTWECSGCGNKRIIDCNKIGAYKFKNA
jgi:predicted RNA-binding Zn-ribbon protein involved in translation (DUF1610 family)